MGPGHTFQYEGGTYNTYTKEEEAGLSPEERDAFLASNNLGPSGHGHHHDPSVSVASADHDHLPDVTLDPDAPGDHHSRFASNEASVSLDDDASVSLDTDHDQDLHHIHMQDHTTDPVATLDDHYDTTHDLHDPAHDFDNHADVSDFT
ncbi:hypothetical protein GO730_28475 [Spirosoma sp. HMF3257]|uniref:Uncharacterized protein n=1 Tax=Spirosoma telluris TaxID=2183553 RepID=A0A327NR49_9BACT|nr:hypothetical protein [Spirosoma telluris]RAI77133.1 hypothetical protein HMF3257_28415 [Spirosoma telluris]